MFVKCIIMLIIAGTSPAYVCEMYSAVMQNWFTCRSFKKLSLPNKTSAEDPNGAAMSIGSGDEGEESKIFAVSQVKCLGMGDPFQLVPELKFNKESNEPMCTSLP